MSRTLESKVSVGLGVGFLSRGLEDLKSAGSLPLVFFLSGKKTEIGEVVNERPTLSESAPFGYLAK